VDEPVLRQYVKDKFQLAELPSRLWLPTEEQGPFLARFASCFAYRMVLGVKDPGPGNFLVRNDPLDVWSLDEGSAFSKQLQPGCDKTWLDSNLGKSKRSPEIPQRLGSVSDVIAILAASWRAIPDLQEKLHLHLGDFGEHLSASAREEALRYITDNLRTLETDWARLCNLPGPVVSVAAAAPPVEAKKKQHEILFGTGDLHESYYRFSYVGTAGHAKSIAEVTSLLQKAIRRNLPDLAHFSAALLLASFKVTKLCNRLMTIATEDIGLGDLHCVKLALDLHELKIRLYRDGKIVLVGGPVARWRQDLRNSQEFRQRLHYCVQAMCVAPKTRLCDHAGMTTFTSTITERLDEGDLAREFRTMLESRGDLAMEERLLRYLGRFIAPSDLSLARENALRICGKASAVLPPELAAVAKQCHDSIRARNDTKPTKMAGKTSLVTVVLLLSRPLASIRIDPASPPWLYNIGILYGDIIAGHNLPVVPVWAKDKHTTYVPNGNQVFLNSEQPALDPKHLAAEDPYYQRAIERAKEKDQIATMERVTKRRVGGSGKSPAGKKQRA